MFNEITSNKILNTIKDNKPMEFIEIIEEFLKDKPKRTRFDILEEIEVDMSIDFELFINSLIENFDQEGIIRGGEDYVFAKRNGIKYNISDDSLYISK